MTVKEFMLNKFPTNMYIDCPIPRHHWETIQEYADKYHNAKVRNISLNKETPIIGSFRLVSKNCVNSNLTASWLQKKGLEHCQCEFKCKVRVQVERKGHSPHTYIITNKNSITNYVKS